MSTPVFEIKAKPAFCEPIPAEKIGSDGVSWLHQHAGDYEFLLAHADDGVIWGRATEEGKLKTARDAAKRHTKEHLVCTFSPELRSETLQQARLFGKTGELLLWKDGDGTFHARRIRDVKDGEDATWTQYVQESWLLHGTGYTALNDSFMLWEDSGQGLCHAVPNRLMRRAWVIEGGKKKRTVRAPRLDVRHYVSKDGYARIEASRLVGFSTK